MQVGLDPKMVADGASNDGPRGLLANALVDVSSFHPSLAFHAESAGRLVALQQRLRSELLIAHFALVLKGPKITGTSDMKHRDKSTLTVTNRQV